MTSELLSQSEQQAAILANPIDGNTYEDAAQVAENRFSDRPRPRLDKIRVIPNTLAINRDLILQVKKSFLYVPDFSTVLNMMIISGKFNIEEVKEHICEAFSRPARTTLDERQILRLKLLPEAFQIASGFRRTLGSELFFTPDIHTTTNALLCTGDFTPQEVVVAICNMNRKPQVKANYPEPTM